MNWTEHFSVSLIRSFGRGRPLSWWNLFACKYRRNCTCLQRHSSTKTIRYVTKLEMYSEHTFWCPGDAKKSTNISTYGMYPSFLHFLFVWKLKRIQFILLLVQHSHLLRCQCLLQCLLSLVLVNSAQVSTARLPFMNKAYGSLQPHLKEGNSYYPDKLANKILNWLKTNKGLCEFISAELLSNPLHLTFSFDAINSYELIILILLENFGLETWWPNQNSW